MSRTQVQAQKTSLIGARVPRSLHREFKAECARRDLEIQDVIAAMIKLFLEDKGFRERVLQELKDKGEN